MSASAIRRATVTGAASGIGEAVARRLLGDGVEVVAVDRDEAGLARVARLGARPLVANLLSPATASASSRPRGRRLSRQRRRDHSPEADLRDDV